MSLLHTGNAHLGHARHPRSPLVVPCDKEELAEFQRSAEVIREAVEKAGHYRATEKLIGILNKDGTFYRSLNGTP